MRIATYLIVLSFLIFGVNGTSWASCGKMHLAQTTHQHTEEIAEEKPVEVGNKICPVSGEKIEEKTKITYEYEGKIYNFCCVMCIEEFKKDPQKYIEKVEEELQAQTQEEVSEEKEMMPGPKMPESMHEGHHH